MFSEKKYSLLYQLLCPSEVVTPLAIGDDSQVQIGLYTNQLLNKKISLSIDLAYCITNILNPFLINSTFCQSTLHIVYQLSLLHSGPDIINMTRGVNLQLELRYTMYA